MKSKIKKSQILMKGIALTGAVIGSIFIIALAINASNLTNYATLGVYEGKNLNLKGTTISSELDSTTNTNVQFEIYKGLNPISNNNTYFKSGDKIIAKVKFDKYLAETWGPLNKISVAPVLKLNNTIEMSPGTIITTSTTDNYTTSIEYTYTIGNEEGNLAVTSLDLDLTNLGTVYAISGSENHPEIRNKKVSASISNIFFDTNPPIVKTKAHVEETNHNNIYTFEKEIIIEATTNETIYDEYEEPGIKVSFSESGTGLYNDADLEIGFGNAKLINKGINEDGTKTWYYKYVVQYGDEGKLQLEYAKGEITDIAGNSTKLTSLNESEHIFHTKDIKVDTSAPTVKINPKETTSDVSGYITNSITNADVVRYVFKWSEEVFGFTEDDITVNNGIKGELVQSETDKTEYVMDITPSTSKGNVGTLQVIIEANKCQDIIKQGNIREESVITIDKQAPILISLEADPIVHPIIVDENVDSVKEYYKERDEIRVVATFSENIRENTKTPDLSLQFSESGNAKGSVSPGVININDDNKIIYYYHITAEDIGKLSVKGFSGTVIDVAGNETIVTKRNLDGNTVIADNVVPELVGITAIVPNFEYNELTQDSEDIKRYGVENKTITENTITIIAEYSEAIYSLENSYPNMIFKVSQIKKETAPNLKLKFNGIDAKGTVKFDKVEGNKVYYKYDITSGDNGDLSIASLSGEVSDMAGNTYTTDEQTKLELIQYYENSIAEETKVDNIKVDTTLPIFTIEATSVNKGEDGNIITGNNGQYRKGSVITTKIKIDEYVYKYNNKELTKFAEDGSDAPQLNINFSTSGNGRGTCTSVEYTNNKTIFTYTYTIKDNDNGMLNLNIATSQIYDIALNGNTEINQSINAISADTIKLYYEDQPGIEYIGNGYRVEFKEDLYYLDENNTVRAFGDVDNAPQLKFEGKDIVYKPSISKNVITYSGEYVNAKAYLGASRLCDIAGNLYSYYDQVAPRLIAIEVTSPVDGTYKAGQEVTIVAKFTESIKGIAPTLKLNFGEEEAKGNVSNGIIEDNTITYNYTITATDDLGDGDNGVLSIKSFTGTELTDLSDNPWTEENTGVTLSGNRIVADTIAPTLIITSDVEKTNKEVVTYTFTWSEDVTGFDKDDIELINGLKGDFKVVNEKVYTLTVDTTNEGRQIVKVNSGACMDLVENSNTQRVTYNKVMIDFTKPTIRAKVNGGNYVLDNTDLENKKSTLKETIVVNEEISKFEYVWSKSTTMPEDGFDTINPDEIQINSDISLEKQVTETGTYYLYIKTTDLAGNTLEGRTKEFIVSNEEITLTPSTTSVTNQDVTVSVEYGEGLTENRKAGVSGKTQSADPNTVIVTENGTVYAEATDKAGNKVCKVLEIENIDKTPIEPEKPPVEEDKTAPTITFNYTTTTATVGTPIGATISTDEDAIISYSWDNNTWTSSQGYVRTQKATRTPSAAGTYTLYTKAVDKSSNQSTVQKLEFTVVNSEEDIKRPEVIFEDLTTIQVNGEKYVKVSSEMTTDNLTSKMDKNALCDATPKYTQLTSDNKLRTGSEITINGETKYVMIVNGDVNGDGKVTFLGDIVKINNYRIGLNKNLSKIQILAADVNNSGEIEFIPDIVAINNYRLGRIKSL